MPTCQTEFVVTGCNTAGHVIGYCRTCKADMCRFVRDGTTGPVMHYHSRVGWLRYRPEGHTSWGR